MSALNTDQVSVLYRMVKRIMAQFTANLVFIVLMPIRGQKDDMEEEKVGETSVLNKQNIYKKKKEC